MPRIHKSTLHCGEKFFSLPSGINSRIVGIIAGGFLFILLLVYLTFLVPDKEPDFGPLPDFAQMQNIKAMKTAFYDYLSPVVTYHNQRILNQRSYLLEVGKKLAQTDKLNSQDRQKLKALAKAYKVQWNDDPLRAYQQLLLRVDIIPVPLALAQAAKESGWGRSRFAVQGNNLFGQWCYTPGCGIVPQNRHANKNHEVARFDSISTAVRRYIHNLNTHPNYRNLRLIRSKMRQAGAEIKALPLAAGLTYYSQRRQAYVTEIQAMIRQYHTFKARRSSL